MQLAARRMAALISNILDFALNRLGGGLPMLIQNDENLAAELDQIIAETRIAHPDRAIDAHIALRESVLCDAPRIGQLFGNLLANAITHGDASAPVVVNAGNVGDWFELSVENSGAEIPAESRAAIFKPFKRLASGQSGLGLGLYIADSIARAHGGTLGVESSPQRTRFVLRIPSR
jgi:signal transduction histidine kinase